MSGTPNEAFYACAAEYDDWYGREPCRSIFAMEVECLSPFLAVCRGPLLEIGVGSGRFASALGVEYGLDPALASLRIAASRGVQAVRCIGEKLPFAKRSFGGVLLALTLCFVGNPLAVLSEARRVLRPEGRLVLGFIPGESPWAGADLERLTLIRRARLLGLSLVETKELVGYAIDGHCSALEIRLARMLDERLAEIDRKMADLSRLKAEMSDYRSRLRKRPCSKRSQAAPRGPAACQCLDNTGRKEETHGG